MELLSTSQVDLYEEVAMVWAVMRTTAARTLASCEAIVAGSTEAKKATQEVTTTMENGRRSHDLQTRRDGLLERQILPVTGGKVLELRGQPRSLAAWMGLEVEEHRLASEAMSREQPQPMAREAAKEDPSPPGWQTRARLPAGWTTLLCLPAPHCHPQAKRRREASSTSMHSRARRSTRLPGRAKIASKHSRER